MDWEINTKDNIFKHFKLSLNLLISHSSLPLQLVGICGFIISVLSIGYGTKLLFSRILNPNYGLVGWNSIMVAITFLSGAILMAIGIIGEYLKRILKEISNEPQYIIEEKEL